MYCRAPLSYAAERGHEAVVKLLLDTEGIDVNLKSIYGQTPLSYATEKGEEAVVKLLLATEGVDVETKDIDGRTPLSWAACVGNEAVVKLLLAVEGVDVETRSDNGRTPLSWAATWWHGAVVKLLIEARADVNIKSDDGRTPLLWAAIKGRRRTVELLVELDKVDLNIDTTLWSKTSSPDLEIMQIIQAAKEKQCSSSKVPTPEPTCIRNESLTEATVASPPTLPSQQNLASLSTLYLSSFGGRNIFLAFWVISCFSILCYFLL